MQSNVEELMTRLLRPTKVLIASERIEEISQALGRYECYSLGYSAETKLDWFDLVIMDAHHACAKKLLHEATPLGIPVAVLIHGQNDFSLLESDNLFIAVLPPVTPADVDRIFNVLHIKAREKEDTAFLTRKQCHNGTTMAQAV